MKDRYYLLVIVGVFLAAYYVPWSAPLIRQSGLEAFLMLQEYAQEHVLTCLIPALFIAGAIAVFVSQAAVIKYFGAGARKNPACIGLATSSLARLSNGLEEGHGN